MLRLPELVKTDRLVIRRWLPDDAELLNRLVHVNLEHLRPWMPWIALEPQSVDQRRQLICEWEDSWANGGDVVFGVLLNDRAIGGAGLHYRGAPDVLHIGYWLDVAHVGKGFATELAGALTSAAFENPEIRRVEIHHDQANEASEAVPRRLGFHRESEEASLIEAPGEVGIDVCWCLERPRSNWPLFAGE